MTRDDMHEVTKSLQTKSAKIRALARFGVSRSEIAKFLGIRYQHVRNVLIQPEPAGGDAPPLPPLGATATEPRDGHRPLTFEEAKLGLAAYFRVPPNAIEITIRG